MGGLGSQVYKGVSFTFCISLINCEYIIMFMIINTFRTNFIFIILCVVALTLLSGCNDVRTDVEYEQTMQQVNEVTNANQFCKRAAVLILIGRYEMAEQYEEDFGTCARRVVKRVTMK